MKLFNLFLGSFLTVNTLCLVNAIEAIDNDSINTQTKDNVTTIVNNKDVVVYTSNKDDKEFIQNLSKKYNGLSNEQAINQLLADQNYIEVLNFLWTEKNAAKKREWLEKQVNTGHPILMFELGEEYYNQNPTLETFVNKTMPWILTGARRALLDADCSSDKSVLAAPEFLLETYKARILNHLTNKYSEEQIEKYVSDHAQDLQNNSLVILKQVLQPIINDDQKNIPAPQWIFAHGMGAFTNEKNSITVDECKTLRKKQAQEFLKQMDQIEKKE